MGIRLLTDRTFNRLYHENERRLTTAAFVNVRDWNVAKDIVSDSFLTVWENRKNIDASINIEAYLFRIVKYKCLHYRRDELFARSVYEKILKKEQGLSDDFTKAIESCDPRELFSREIEEIYKAEIDRMLPLTKKIYEAHKIEGKSYREISENLNIGLKKVDNELQSATRRLREALKDYLAVITLFMWHI